MGVVGAWTVGWSGVDGLHFASFGQPVWAKQRQLDVAAIAPMASEGFKACANVSKNHRSWWLDDIREGCHENVVGHGDVGGDHQAVPHEVADSSPDKGVGEDGG